MAVVVVSLDRGFLDRAIHPLDLPIRPRVLQLGQPVLNSVLLAAHVEHVRHDNAPSDHRRIVAGK